MMRIRMRHLSIVLAACALVAAAHPVESQAPAVTVTGTVAVASKSRPAADLANVVVWLKPLRDTGASRPAPAGHQHIVQKDKRFEPHLLVVPVGSVIDFPNRDPFFHNVFSMYDGKRFDLGLYESGSSRGVTFSKPGVSFIFCNIHPEMSAIVMALDTPHYAVSNRSGRFTIGDVPAGTYRLFVWHERHQPPGGYPREVAVDPAHASLETIQLIEGDSVIAPHTNKYGKEYHPPSPPNPIYDRSGR